MTTKESVEHFHLVFLKHFANAISPGTICLKGGVNLRLYQGSPRLSEDMDFDARIVAKETLKKNVNKTLAGQPLLSELAAARITLGKISALKQTDTSQRWKFEVINEEQRTPTRLEFSRPPCLGRTSRRPFFSHITVPPRPTVKRSTRSPRASTPRRATCSTFSSFRPTLPPAAARRPN